MRERGYASVSILALLLVFSLLLGGIVFFLQSLSGDIRRVGERLDIEQRLAQRAEMVVAVLAARERDEIDSALSPVLESIADLEHDGFRLRLNDISSYLGLNWIRKGLLDRTGLLSPEFTPENFQQFREDRGPQINLDGYGRFFREDIELADYFTVYSYFNINLCDEFVLRHLYEARSGSSIGAETFHTRVHNYRLDTREQEFLDSEGLIHFLGVDFAILYPVVNAEPVLNVNFAPEAVLRVALEAGGRAKPDALARSLLELRETQPLGREALEFILGEDYQETAVRHYLGFTTWFWRLEVEREGAVLQWILARVPGQPESPAGAGTQRGVSLRIVEESYAL